MTSFVKILSKKCIIGVYVFLIVCIGGYTYAQVDAVNKSGDALYERVVDQPDSAHSDIVQILENFVDAVEDDHPRVHDIVTIVIDRLHEDLDISPDDHVSDSPIPHHGNSPHAHIPIHDASVHYGNMYIDISQVQESWISRVNQVRSEHALHQYMHEDLLHISATDRASQLRQKGIADHKRYSHSSYYDYHQITQWFADRGLVFQNWDRSTHTENIGQASFGCAFGDCTDEAVKSMRSIFDYFVSEASYNGVHRRTIVHPRFEIVGVGIDIDVHTGKLFGVMHYGTALE